MTPSAPAKGARSRSPKGVSSAHRIGLNLTPEERTKLEAIAARESRTLSAMSRLMVLSAMKAFEDQPTA